MVSIWPGPWTRMATRSTPCGSASWPLAIDRPVVSEQSYFTAAWSADSRTALLHRGRRGQPAVPGPPAHDGRRTGRDDVDELVVEEPDASFELTVHGTRSGELILVRAGSRESTELAWLPAAEPTRPPQVIWPRRPGIEYDVDHVPAATTGLAGELVIVTNDGAPEFRVLRAPLAHPEPADAVELLGPDPDDPVGLGRRHRALGRRRRAAATRCPSCASSTWTAARPTTSSRSGRPGRSRWPATRTRTRRTSGCGPSRWCSRPTWFDVDLATGERTPGQGAGGADLRPEPLCHRTDLGHARPTGRGCRSAWPATWTRPSTAPRPACSGATAPTSRATGRSSTRP